MKTTNIVPTFRGPTKLLNFGNGDVVDVAGISDKVLQVVQEEEDTMNIDVKDAECAKEEKVSCAPLWNP
jgi:hypothetical protein